MSRIARTLTVGILLLGTVPILQAQRRATTEPTAVTTPTGSHGFIVRPADNALHRGVLHLHGSGDNAANNVDVLRLLAEAGYVALDVDYRETRGVIDRADIDASIEFLKGQRFTDRSPIALNGFSLGARLALKIAQHRQVAAVSAIAARTSGGGTPTVLDEAQLLTVPVLLQHGSNDPVVPYQDSVLLERKLLGLGRQVTLVTHQGAGHTDLPWRDVYENVTSFFAKYAR